MNQSLYGLTSERDEDIQRPVISSKLMLGSIIPRSSETFFFGLYYTFQKNLLYWSSCAAFNSTNRILGSDCFFKLIQFVQMLCQIRKIRKFFLGYSAIIIF